MYSRHGLTARQVGPMASALILTLLLPGSALAQDGTPAPDAETAADPEVAAQATPAKPGKFRLASVPKGTQGQTISDVVAGGPGYIAVGGGSRDGLDLKPIIWVSDSGSEWQSVPLFADAGQGVISAVAHTPVGYIAVGHDFVPQGRTEPTQALVWRSDEGLIWERVPTQTAFDGSMMFDVAGTPDGVVAVGCHAASHCINGRTWTSADGMTWELSAEDPMLPYAVAATGGNMVSGGVNSGDYGTGQSLLASSPDGTAWTATDPLSDPQSGVADVTTDDAGYVATGSWWPSGADIPASTIYTSPDGEAWETITADLLGGITTAAVASDAGLTLLAGNDAKGQPSILWSNDRELWAEGKFAKKPARDGSTLDAAVIDGDLAFTVGANKYRPAIWISQLK